MKRKASIIIPAYNEERIIEETLEGLNTGCWEEIIVVDDGSTDRTGILAKSKGAKVLRNPIKKGKSSAVAKGVAKASEEIILFVDADLGSTAELIAKIYDTLKAGDFDMVVGVLPEKQGGFGVLRKLAHWGIHVTTKENLQQPLSGQRAMRKEVYLNSLNTCRGFGLEMALTIDALRGGYRIREIPLPLTHRYTKRNLKGFIHRGKQTFDILQVIFRRLYI